MLSCDEHFTHAFTACGCVFKKITLDGSSQGNYFENTTACSKSTLKATAATQLKVCFHITFQHTFSASRCIIEELILVWSTKVHIEIVITNVLREHWL